jgi:hypothetical protein
MPVTELPFASGFYQSDSLTVSSQACVNLYPVIEEAASLSQETLRGTPGIELVVAAGSGVNRGAHALNGVPYFVQGNELYRLESGGTASLIGAITGSGRVSMDDNGTQLMICVPGGDGYIFVAAGDTLTTISDVDYTTTSGVPQSVVFIDGYLCVTTDDKKFKISSLNDGLTWNALDFGSAESSPDGVIAPVVYRNQLFIGGERTMEAFSNIGGAGFPFTRTGLFLEQGISGIFGIVNAKNTFAFIGAGADELPAIWKLVGNETEKISTRAIDKLILGLSEAELALVHAFSYGQLGNYYIGFSLGATTVVYDLMSQKWHERQSVYDVGGTVTTAQWRGSSVVSAYGKLYVGDLVNENIGELKTDVYAEYSLEILRSFSTQPLLNNMKPFSVPMIELTMESGTGVNDVTNPQDEEPMVYFDQSFNGGKTWSEKRGRRVGRIGEYYRRTIWRRNGTPMRFVCYRFSISSAVKVAVAQLVADVRPVQ